MYLRPGKQQAGAWQSQRRYHDKRRPVPTLANRILQGILRFQKNGRGNDTELSYMVKTTSQTPASQITAETPASQITAETPASQPPSHHLRHPTIPVIWPSRSSHHPRHSGESRNPRAVAAKHAPIGSPFWFPAHAGMTSRPASQCRKSYLTTRCSVAMRNRAHLRYSSS